MASRLIKPGTAREETASERASTRVYRPKRKEVRKTWLRWDNSSSCSASGSRLASALGSRRMLRGERTHRTDFNHRLAAPVVDTALRHGVHWGYSIPKRSTVNSCRRRRAARAGRVVVLVVVQRFQQSRAAGSASGAAPRRAQSPVACLTPCYKDSVRGRVERDKIKNNVRK
jgi:hypothetical protein